MAHSFRFLRSAWIVMVAVLIALLGLCAPAGAMTHRPTVWVADSADRVFSSSPVPTGASDSIELNAARGEQESAQIAVRAGSRDVPSTFVIAGPLHSDHGSFLPLSAVTVHREYNHPNITKFGTDVQQPPDGGNAYYDALVDNKPTTVTANTTQPFYYSVRIPDNQRAGRYTGTAIVVSGSGPVLVPVTLNVYPVTLPAPDKSAFQMNNWTATAGWDYKGTIQAIPVQYGVKMYDPNWWRVVTNIAKNEVAHRNNVAYADFQGLLIPKTTIDSSGKYHLDWTDFDRFVKIFAKAGSLQWIYTPTLLEPSTNANGIPNLEMMKNVDGKTQKVLVPPNTPESTAYLDMLFPALRAHLDKMGWSKMFVMSALDEPSTQGQIDAANWFYHEYRKFFPDGYYNTNEAHLRPEPGLGNDLTTVTPIIDNYENNVGYYQDQRISGVGLWLYNCIGPAHLEMNRFISYHLDETRLTPWLVWKIGGSGYQHWGWNMWFNSPSGPFTKIDTFTSAQTGDNYLVYPDVKKYSIYNSLRSETQLDGAEDFELLTMLSKTSPLTAREIAQKVINNVTSYTRDGQDVVDAHKMLLDALADGAQDKSTPFSDSFNNGDRSWTHTMGSWNAADSTYTQSDQSGWGVVSAVKGPAWSDATVSTDLKINSVNPSGGNTNWAGVVLRNYNATDMDSGYLVAVRDNGEAFLYRAGKTLATSAIPGYQPGSKVPLRITVQGNVLTAYSGNTQLFNYTDQQNGFPNGQIGLATGGSNTTFGPVSIQPGQSPTQ